MLRKAQIAVAVASVFWFGAGNAITGKGNIVASRRHSIQVATHLIEQGQRLTDERLHLQSGRVGEVT